MSHVSDYSQEMAQKARGHDWPGWLGSRPNLEVNGTKTDSCSMEQEVRILVP